MSEWERRTDELEEARKQAAADEKQKGEDVARARSESLRHALVTANPDRRWFPK